MAAKSVRDMILSLIAVMLAGFGIYLFIPHGGGSGVHPVQYRDAVLSARRAAPYPLLAPASTPKGWNATSVNYDPEDPANQVWTLGFIDADKQYVAIEQSNAPAADVIKDATVDAVKQSAVSTVDGVAWTHYSSGHYRALVQTTAKGTTVVYGTETFDRLASFAASLTSK